LNIVAAVMIHHLVLFRWKKSTAPAQVDRALAALRDLPGQIPGIDYLAVGPALATGSDYDAGLVAHFANQAALDAYDLHPHHQAVIRDAIEPILDQLAYVDFDGA
jgi:hypothetical protein